LPLKKYVKLMMIDFHTHNLSPGISQFFMADLKIPQNLTSNQYFFIGIHPWKITDSFDANNQLTEFKNVYKKAQKHSQFLGLGEVGLDKIKPPSLKIQADIFQKQLEFAISLNVKTIVLHNVKTFDCSLEILKTSGFRGKLILHDFYAHPNVYEQFNKHCKAYISLGMRGLNSRHLLSYPLESCLLETDDSNESIKNIYKIASEKLTLSVGEIDKELCKRLKEIVQN
tara:strand:- start:35551 stop:36231 length:681 start_codon:yes stop_codon:yes gene_type:complete